jgi:ribosome-associated toxin RatA of RatAB toxin-antitoxin module
MRGLDMRTPTRAVSFLVALLASTTVVPSQAKSPSPSKWSPPAVDAEAVALAKAGGLQSRTVAVAGAKHSAGRADVLVAAPVATVRAAVLAYERYGQMIPRFQKVKVLARNGLGADVYLVLPVMHGAASIWSVQRFAPPVAAAKGGNETVTSASVKGNVDALRTTWRYRAVDGGHTLLSVEIYVEPKLAVPSALVAGEAEKAAREAVVSMQAHTEGVAPVQTVKAP